MCVCVMLSRISLLMDFPEDKSYIEPAGKLCKYGQIACSHLYWWCSCGVLSGTCLCWHLSAPVLINLRTLWKIARTSFAQRSRRYLHFMGIIICSPRIRMVWTCLSMRNPSCPCCSPAPSGPISFSSSGRMAVTMAAGMTSVGCCW